MKTIFCLALSLAFLAAVVGCTTNPVTGKPQVALINRDQEIAMGREAAPQFEKEFEGLVADKVLQDYVASVGAKLGRASVRPMPYEFALLNSKIPNAFALPGGKIYVTRGLMKLMENECELAAVLGHEVGHVAAMHHVNRLNFQLGSEILIEIAGGEGKAAEVTKVVTFLVTMQHTQKDEYQADKLGIEYMVKAGYNPHGMIGLLNHLKSLNESEPGILDQMFLTHPLTSKRIAEATNIVKTNHPAAVAAAPDPNVARFLVMKARLK